MYNMKTTIGKCCCAEMMYIVCLMQCVKSVLMNKIVSSEKDLVGVVFFGTVSMYIHVHV